MTPRARGRSPEASDAVRGEWLRRIEAKYRSAAITQHLTLWLMQIGASPDLVRAGLRIASDEITHAELSHEVYGRARETATPSTDRAWGLTPLTLDRAAVDKTFQRDWLRRFRRVGIDAAAAWDTGSG